MPEKKALLSADVAFVGSLYNEGHNFLDRMTDLDDYTKGYLDAIMNAQRKINGYFFIEELLTPNILASLKRKEFLMCAVSWMNLPWNLN